MFPPAERMNLWTILGLCEQDPADTWGENLHIWEIVELYCKEDDLSTFAEEGDVLTLWDVSLSITIKMLLSWWL